MANSKLNRWKDFYSATAIVVLNSIVLVLVLNVLLGAAFFVWDLRKQPANLLTEKLSASGDSERLFAANGSPISNGKRSSHHMIWFDYTAYAESAAEEYVAKLLEEFYAIEQRGFLYQPWVQFSEPPFSGALLNVDIDEKGFPIRRTINSAEGEVPKLRVFTFGGSTTFGYNVSDEHTWPTFLSAVLNEKAQSLNLNMTIEVTNYGRGYYNPSQETALLLDLVKTGRRPDAAIFMDGVNWGLPEDVPQFATKFHEEFEDMQTEQGSEAVAEYIGIPMVRLVNEIAVRSGLKPNQNRNRRNIAKEEEDKNSPSYVNHVVSRFKVNQEVAAEICRMYDIQPIFFLQPDAVYNYNLSLYRLKLPDRFLRDRPRREKFYRMMSGAKGYVDLTGLFDSWGDNRKAIVDNVHYSPAFNRYLAEHVAAHLDLEALAAARPASSRLDPTGEARTVPDAAMFDSRN